MKLQEVTSKVDLIAVQSRLRVAEGADASTTQIQSRLDLDILRTHRKGCFLALFEESERSFLHFEFHVVPSLMVVFVDAPVAKRICQFFLVVHLFERGDWTC